jgi:hypothetical protein
MNQPVSINAKLIDSLAQIILSLTDPERQILAHKIQHPSLSGEEIELRWKDLQREIELGAEQLQKGDYTEYDTSSLPNLLENIKRRRQKRLQSESD